MKIYISIFTIKKQYIEVQSFPNNFINLKSDSSIMSSVTNTFKLSIMGLMILSGAINTIAYKFQNTQYVYEGGYYKLFFHPYMQTAAMFFGQFLALFVFLAMKRKNPEVYQKRMLEAKQKGLKIEMNKFLLAIPGLFDFITSSLHLVALNFVSGSVYQMMRGGTIITTLIFSKIFLKSKVFKHQIAGAMITLLGVTIVGFSNLYFSDSSSGGADSGLQVFGYILLIISLFTNGFHFVFQQKLLSQYYLEPMQVVGYEGMFVVIIEIILLPILTFIPCHFSPQTCVFNLKDLPFIERPEMYFYQIGSNAVIFVFVILGVFSILTFNICGVTVTKYISALARSITDVARTVIIWIFGIIITLSLGSNNPNFKWQLIGVGAILVQLVGFVLLVSGNLIYNKMVKLPCFKYSEETQKSLIQQDQGDSYKTKQ